MAEPCPPVSAGDGDIADARLVQLLTALLIRFFAGEEGKLLFADFDDIRLVEPGPTTRDKLLWIVAPESIPVVGVE